MSTAAYTNALLNQEKSLEDLQRHLRTTEELFRESVKRKNQQLDLLQSEVRRLKSSVAGRDDAASGQMEAALNAQGVELEKTRERLRARDGEVDALNAEMVSLKSDLQEERLSRRIEGERATDASGLRAQLAERAKEVEALQKQLAQAQAIAAQHVDARAAAEAKLQQAQAELAEMRRRDEGVVSSSAELQLATQEADGLRAQLQAKSDELRKEAVAHDAAKRRAVAAEAELAAASSQAAAAGGAEVEALRQKLADQSAAQQRAAAAAEEQQQKLRERLNAAEAQSAAAVAGLAPAASAPAASGGGGATYGSNLDDDDAGGDELDVRAAPAAPDSGGGPAVTALSLGGDATLGGTLLAMPTLDGADLADCVFAWFRGATLLPYADASALPLSVEDVGQVMAVEVTPISADGSEGAAVRAESTPISLSADVHRALRSYIDRGECPFAGCIDGERERTLLFTRDKLKVRDGKSTAFKDNYQATQLALSPADAAAFELAMPSAAKKAGGLLRLRVESAARRDMLYLTYRSFATNGGFLARVPAAQGTAGALGIDLASLPRADGPPSPTSSEAPSQTASEASAPGSSSRSKLGGLGGMAIASKRTLSFSRNKKK